MTSASRREFLCLASKYSILGLGVVPALSAIISGCKTLETITNVGVSLGTATGVVSHSQAQSIEKSSQAVLRTFQDITPEQEYYIGRTVGAVILGKYGPYKNNKANWYINVLGQTLAQASDLPETFGGYRILIQDSDEINALAAPGGLIFVTRGILKCCRHEDAVAAVLAHEIGHVQHKHGLQAIKKSRITSALTTIGIEGTKSFGGAELTQLTEAFENSISDITKTMINSGYSRSFERQADKAAVTMLKRVGYDPNGLVEMLNMMEQKLKPGGLDFAKTHPSPASRISDIQKHIGGYSEVKRHKARQTRFDAALGSI